MIEALQSRKLVSTVKHFAVYSIPVGGRDGKTRTDPHVAPREMRTLYLEPFRVAFEEAGALGTMSSYNDYDGEPVTGSHYFLTELLRDTYGFRGYVVSDSWAVEYIQTKHAVVVCVAGRAVFRRNCTRNERAHFAAYKTGVFSVIIPSKVCPFYKIVVSASVIGKLYVRTLSA